MCYDDYYEPLCASCGREIFPTGITLQPFGEEEVTLCSWPCLTDYAVEQEERHRLAKYDTLVP